MLSISRLFSTSVQGSAGATRRADIQFAFADAVQNQFVQRQLARFDIQSGGVEAGRRVRC